MDPTKLAFITSLILILIAGFASGFHRWRSLFAKPRTVAGDARYTRNAPAVTRVTTRAPAVTLPPSTMAAITKLPMGRGLVSTLPPIITATAKLPMGRSSFSTADKPPGTWCNVSSCSVEIRCRGYVFCQRLDKTGNPDAMDGTLATVLCETGTFAIPIHISNKEPKEVVAGSCVKWEDLEATRRQEIILDEECTYCEIVTVGDSPCTSQFKYKLKTGELGELHQCYDDRIIDIQQKSCIPPCLSTGKLREACVANNKCSNNTTS